MSRDFLVILWVEECRTKKCEGTLSKNLETSGFVSLLSKLY